MAVNIGKAISKMQGRMGERSVLTGLRKVLIGLGLATLSMSGLAQVASADASDPAAKEQLFVDLINQARAEKNLPALTIAPVLVDFARGWSEQMRKTSVATDPEGCVISHNPKLGTIKADWRRLGENVGCGDVGVEALNKDFIASPLHYANMVDPRFTHVGIGIVLEGDMMWVTEQFMEYRTPKPTAAPAEIPLVSTGNSKVLGAVANGSEAVAVSAGAQQTPTAQTPAAKADAAKAAKAAKVAAAKAKAKSKKSKKAKGTKPAAATASKPLS